MVRTTLCAGAEEEGSAAGVDELIDASDEGETVTVALSVLIVAAEDELRAGSEGATYTNEVVVDEFAELEAPD